MDVSPVYYDPVISVDHTFDLNAWNECVRLYEKGRYIEAFVQLLKYINPRSYKKYILGKNHWMIPHGSITVEIIISEQGDLEIKAPFLRMPPENNVGILRQIGEINFNILILSQIVLKKDEFHFVFKTPLALTDPYKIYDTLSEICWQGDKYSHIFIEKFKAVLLEERKVSLLTQKQIERGWELFQFILDEIIRYVSYFQSKRWLNCSYDMMAIGLMKIDYALSPQGFLRTEIERIIQILYEKKSMENVVSEIHNELLKLKAYPKEHFIRDLYESRVFIPYKRQAGLESCQNQIKERYEWAKKDRSGGSGMGVVLNYLFSAYYLFYYNYLPREIKKEIIGVFKKCSKKPWNHSQDVMWASFQKIMAFPMD